MTTAGRFIAGHQVINAFRSKNLDSVDTICYGSDGCGFPAPVADAISMWTSIRTKALHVNSPYEAFYVDRNLLSFHSSLVLDSRIEHSTRKRLADASSCW